MTYKRLSWLLEAKWPKMRNGIVLLIYIVKVNVKLLALALFDSFAHF